MHAVSFKIRSQHLDVTDQSAQMYVKGAYALNVRSFQCVRQTCSPKRNHCHGMGIPDKVEPQDVKILIGVDNPEAHVQLDVRRGLPDQPLAVRTKLGWSLIGVDGRRTQMPTGYQYTTRAFRKQHKLKIFGALRHFE